MFRLLERDNLRAHWPMMRRGLEIISASRKEGWIPEDVFMAIASGAAAAYLAYGAQDAIKGFVVLTFSQGYESRECHVWCAYNEGSHEFMVQSDALLPEIAKAENCRYLTFFSQRPGWEKCAPAMGWERVHTLYRKEVT